MTQSEQLHGKIMNIQADHQASTGEYKSKREAYIFGHRDARHAAAELALTFPGSADPALVLLAHAPKFAGCATAEPTLRSLIYRYYRAHFADQNVADDLAFRYIDSLLSIPPTPSPL